MSLVTGGATSTMDSLFLILQSCQVEVVEFLESFP